ncbi:MAG: ribose 5-phosphate isomerase B [Armatimonadia bacterium]
MKIILGSDHAGYEMKEVVRQFVASELGHEVEDAGTHSQESCDFPRYAQRVGRAVVRGDADFGILVCGTGIGMCIAANKIPGVAAAHCCDSYSARMTRLHNAANVLCLGGRILGVEIARDIVRNFLAAPVDDGERYARRREQVRSIERNAEAEL